MMNYSYLILLLKVVFDQPYSQTELESLFEGIEVPLQHKDAVEELKIDNASFEHDLFLDLEFTVPQ